MKSSGPVERLLKALGRRDSARAPSRPGKAEPHSFREKVFRKKPPACAVCKGVIEGAGLACRVCKVAAHRKCEAKVTWACQAAPPADSGSMKSLNQSKQRSTLPRSVSVEAGMERRWELDVTYITERIISVCFPPGLDERRYGDGLRQVAAMLQAKHQNHYLLFNLSEKRHDLSRLHPKVQEFGWPDLHAPPLDRICSICKALEGWLAGHAQRVAVLHCRGNKGKTGVIVAAYMHYSNISASADQALGTLAMHKFCEDKVAAALQPSQRRYIDYFSGLLSGAIKMNSSPLFLQQVLVPALPAFEPGTGFQPFLKIYQAMQLVYTSGIYRLTGPGPQQLCISLEPALLLKGDVMVTCYHRSSGGQSRASVFRVQFHTCTVHGPRLRCGKDQLDQAWQDERFPFEAAVEFVFSSGPEKIGGRDCLRDDPAVSVDYNTSEPAVRWDSYEDFNRSHEDGGHGWPSHTRGPLDGSLYAQVQRPRPAAASGEPPAPSPVAAAARPSPPAPLLSVSTDSGHWSNVTERPDDPASPGRPPPTPAEREELDRLLGGCGLGPRPPPAPAPAPDAAAAETPAGGRETAILDDEDEPGRAGGHLGGYRAARPGLVRHCSCRHGYREPFGPQHGGGGGGGGGYYRPEGTLERRRPACGAYEAYEAYGDGTMEKRRLYRSLSEGPYPYRLEPGPRDPGGFGYGPPGYREVLILEEPGPAAPCPCPTCREKEPGLPPAAAAAAAAFYGLRLEREPAPADPWPAGAGKGALLHPLPLLVPAYGAHARAEGPDCGYLRPPKAGDAGYPCARLAPPGYPPVAAYGCGGAGPACCGGPAYGRAPRTCGAPCPSPCGLAFEGAEEGGEAYPGGLAPAAPAELSQWHPMAVGPGSLQRPKPREARPGVPAAAQPAGSPAGSPTPLHTSSPVQGRESPRPPGPRRGSDRRADPPPRSARSPGESGPRAPVPAGLPGLRQAAWPGPRPPPDSPDGSPLTPVPTQVPWLVAGPPAPRGSPTPAFPLPDSPPRAQPPLPEKRHPPGPQPPSPPAPHHVTFAPPAPAGPPAPPEPAAPPSQSDVKFVQDTTKFWYKPQLSREEAISLLKGREPGDFLIRDSHSFQGAYGLALRVATAPHGAQAPRGDPLEQLVRHFLIETGPRGVKIKGCASEPYFGSLPALVSQHSISPISLPCRLRIPSKDPLDDSPEVPVVTNMSTAADLLRQGAACSVLYLGSVETESLTGPQAVGRAGAAILDRSPRPPATPVHFKVTAQGITLTDSQRKLFFRRHYPVSSVTFCSVDPQDRRWTNADGTTSKVFGFVARKAGSPAENVCHLFAELDPEQPAAAITAFISKVLLGAHRK
ncbi:tensin-2 isoform X2 [Tachyglossus aculeatus]|uniref:tensin-2 isoform X2 n=1 Tax=Tachyglossus aculeatus TaxID=9261 RepID=UPI0018F3F467|nr:tensin-2 isoform X2 [Tachyglossus aculeatus]